MIPSLPTADVLIPMALVLGMICIRLASLLFIAPVLGATVIPRRIRGAIAALLSLIIFAGLSSAPRIPLEPLTIIIAALGEVAVGAAAGIAATLVFSAVEGAGMVLGIPMGMGFSQLVDPMTKAHSVVTSRLLMMIASMIFIATDAHHVLIRLVARSFQILPPGQVVISSATGSVLARDASTIFKGSVQLAAPVLLVILGVMLALGLLARIAPRINLLVLSFAISIGLGLVALRAALPDMGVWITNAMRRIEPAVLNAFESFV